MTSKRYIILHMFNWRLVDIIKELKNIKNCGYTAIQISPIQLCKDANGIWWEVYQPFSFKIGNRIGTKKDLKLLCRCAKKLGLKIICDIIVDHVASDEENNLKPHSLVDKKLLDNKYFWKEPVMVSDWNNRQEVITRCCGLPSLRLDNYDLQDIIIDFMNELIDCGVGGFRIDSGKSISLPEEHSDFWIRVFNRLKNKDELINYAEIIFSDSDLINKYLKYINVLTNAYDGVSDKSKITTFFMSHDTELEFKYTNKMNDSMIIEQWRFLLANNLVSNMLFYVRPSSDLWKSNEIKAINLEYN